MKKDIGQIFFDQDLEHLIFRGETIGPARKFYKTLNELPTMVWVKPPFKDTVFPYTSEAVTYIANIFATRVLEETHNFHAYFHNLTFMLNHGNFASRWYYDFAYLHWHMVSAIGGMLDNYIKHVGRLPDGLITAFTAFRRATSRYSGFR